MWLLFLSYNSFRCHIINHNYLIVQAFLKSSNSYKGLVRAPLLKISPQNITKKMIISIFDECSLIALCVYKGLKDWLQSNGLKPVRVAIREPEVSKTWLTNEIKGLAELFKRQIAFMRSFNILNLKKNQNAMSQHPEKLKDNCTSIYLSICLSVCLSVYLSIYLSFRRHLEFWQQWHLLVPFTGSCSHTSLSYGLITHMDWKQYKTCWKWPSAKQHTKHHAVWFLALW